MLIYMRDLERGTFWLCGGAGEDGLQPAGGRIAGMANVTHVQEGIECLTEICVPPGSDMELRRITLRNLGGLDRAIEITTFLEVALHQPMAYASHPAFSKLFVQTEYVGEHGVLLAQRRPRGSTDASPCMFQALLGPGELLYETDRAAFIGRGHCMSAARALVATTPMGGGVGNVLDPAFAMRRTVSLPAHGSVALLAVIGGAETREAVSSTIRELRSVNFESAAAMAASHEAERARSLDLTPEEALSYQYLAGAMYHYHPGLWAAPETRKRASGHPGIVWGYGLPTDSPLAVIGCGSDAEISRWAKVQAYWRSLGLDTTMLLVTDVKPGSIPELADASLGIVQRLRGDISPAHLDVMLTVARLVAGYTFGKEIGTRATPVPSAAVAAPSRTYSGKAEAYPTPDLSGLRFSNGYGGFSEDGREYVIHLPARESGLGLPPLPWSNVIANSKIGCLVTETGGGCTWSRNSHEWRLTPWSNDPVLDPHGEKILLQDDVTGECWSPLPGPSPSGEGYEVRHGFGYSCFLHRCHGISQETTVFVAREDPVKLVRITLCNESREIRRLAVSSSQRLVLGFLPSQASRFIQTQIDDGSHIMFARNALGGNFADGIAFASCACGGKGVWEGASGTATDPSFDQVCKHTLDPGEKLEVTFLLGDCPSEAEIRALVEKYRESGAIDRALEEAKHFWHDLLSGVQIETPCIAVDFMVNGWLAYQNLSCRVWGRTAFYQSSGAFGFRDQLQDASALIHLHPEFTREQILVHAAHQYVEGDVMHWWHPAPSGFGLRTHFSDDLNWLPYVTSFYVKSTGDVSVLDEIRPFLKGRPLEPGEDETGMIAEWSSEKANVYEHCCRALDRSLTKGAHGLPLMGTGDWNDGMNRVGREGRGESVWMGFFLYHIIGHFLPLCELRGDQARVETYRAYREHLRVALNEGGWDGQWYRRAYYDDGTPLGSAENDECQIDALAQSWAVISGAAPADRANQAMDEAEKRLVDEKGGLIRLLTPAFVNTPHDPGYIKGYVAGVRENGGQYTHGACWVVRALAELGRTERAAKLLEMLSPVSHSSSREGADLFKLEPYVVAADVYGEPPHVGRGGWNWYTGSAGWLYRVALESVLGLSMEGGVTLVLKPCIPAAWTKMRIRYTMPDRSTVIEIAVSNPNGGSGVVSASLDGVTVPVVDGSARIPIIQDGGVHHAKVVLGP